MNEQDVRRIAQEEIRKSNDSSRFGISTIPQTRVNNLNVTSSPSQVLTYAGFVPYDISSPLLESFLPAGWSLRYTGTGEYTIIHNLGTYLYSLVACATQSTNQIAVPVVSPFLNEVSIIWFSNDGFAAVDTSFNFLLTQINNRKSSFPKYTTQNVS